MSLIPGKRCKKCRDGSCGECTRGFIIKPRKASRVRAKASGRQKLDDEYSKLRKVFLMKNPRCLTLGPNGPCNAPTTDVHHRKLRGRYLLVEETWFACCHSCHDRIHQNPRWARAMNYLLNTANDHIEAPSLIFIPYDRSPDTNPS
jgi:hypothetical protein